MRLVEGHLSSAPLSIGETIGQGFDMGRPSLLAASADKQAGKVTATYIGSRCVPVMSGTINLGRIDHIGCKATKYILYIVVITRAWQAPRYGRPYMRPMLCLRYIVMSLGTAVAGSLIALNVALAEELKPEEPKPPLPVSDSASCEIPKVELEAICLKTWKENALRKLRERDGKAFEKYEAESKTRATDVRDPLWQLAPKPHFVCDAFVVEIYKAKGLALPLNHLRASVDRQKDVVERRWEAASARANWTQIIIVVLGSLVTLAGAATAAFTATPATPTGRRTLLALKIAGVVLPITLTAVTSIAAFFDHRSLAVAESRASMALSELQSQIEEAVITGCVRAGEPGEKPVIQPLTLSAIVEWQGRLATILRTDTDAYIKRRETQAPLLRAKD